MTDSLDRINALLAEMPTPVAQQLVQRFAEEAERLQAEPPPLVPGPAFPYGRGSTMARWSCRTGCGWAYEEDADPGLPQALVLPADFTADDVSAAISAQAAERSGARLDRVQEAFVEHYRTAHPDLLEESHGVPAPAAR